MCATILGWRAGYPRRLGDNLWISRLRQGRLCTCFAFALWRTSASLYHFTFSLWRRAHWCSSLNLRQGVSLKINWRKKEWGWEILNNRNFPILRRWSLLIRKLAFFPSFWKVAVILKVRRRSVDVFPSRFYLRKSDLFSFSPSSRSCDKVLVSIPYFLFSL